MNITINTMIKEIAKRIDEDRNNPILTCHKFNEYIEGLLTILVTNVIKELDAEEELIK